MQKHEIEMYLAELGQELENLGVPHAIRILLIGGAFMLTQIGNRQATDDIDILLKDGGTITTSPLYQTFQTAIRSIATKNHLKNNWINDIMGDFLQDTGLIPEGVLWRQYGNLEIFLPSKEYILALKLLAGRRKDVGDTQALCKDLQIQTREQAQKLVDLHIPDKQIQQLYQIDRTLEVFFP
jgi:hypothetical protein